MLKEIVVVLGAFTMLLQVYKHLAFRQKHGPRSYPAWVYTRGVLGSGLMVSGMEIIALAPIIPIESFILLASGLSLRLWAIWALGDFWTPDALALEGHELVDTGPYKFMLHPMYDAYVLIGMGVWLIRPTPESLVVWVFFFCLLFLRALQENALMRKRHGQAHVVYCNRPTLWFRSAAETIREVCSCYVTET